MRALQRTITFLLARRCTPRNLVAWVVMAPSFLVRRRRLFVIVQSQLIGRTWWSWIGMVRKGRHFRRFVGGSIPPFRTRSFLPTTRWARWRIGRRPIRNALALHGRRGWGLSTIGRVSRLGRRKPRVVVVGRNAFGRNGRTRVGRERRRTRSRNGEPYGKKLLFGPAIRSPLGNGKRSRVR